MEINSTKRIDYYNGKKKYCEKYCVFSIALLMQNFWFFGQYSKTKLGPPIWWSIVHPLRLNKQIYSEYMQTLMELNLAGKGKDLIKK